LDELARQTICLYRGGLTLSWNRYSMNHNSIKIAGRL